MKTKTPSGTALPDKRLFARQRPVKKASKVTQAVELLCRQCKKPKTMHYGPTWTPPSDGIMAMCKNDKCLTQTIHDFVRFIPPEKSS